MKIQDLKIGQILKEDRFEVEVVSVNENSMTVTLTLQGALRCALLYSCNSVLHSADRRTLVARSQTNG